MQPILKWAGGKKQILNKITALFPKNYKKRRYHEPMVGGGAVFFWLEPNSGTINDINKHLIRFYKIVRDKPEELIEEVKKHPYDKDHYYKMRDKYNHGKNLNNLEKAALFLYFNKTAYNGLWRVNSKGEFNVPFGDYNNPKIVDEKAIKKASEILENVEIYSKDFGYILEKAKKGDLVYFDPPYQPVSETANFTEYTKEGFDLDEQKRLFETIVKLHNKGIKFILSNSYAKPIRKMYKGKKFKIEVLTTKRYISCKSESRKGAKEILITNIEPEERAQKRL